MLLSHISIQCDDVPKSAAFYDAVLAPLGAKRVMDFGDAVAYGTSPEEPQLWLGPFNSGEGFRESHIAFVAPSHAAVDAFHQAALDQGMESLHAPRLWPEYTPTYYAGFVRDPDGNNVEAVTMTPETA